ncbi:MAG: hypothetical protein GY736_06780, partial [Sphingomonas sp.]|uniref:hypothetical protein n=1 Tax=Sphingomonas sp. TaxID=28214 RepID=UPI0025842A05
MIYDTLPFLPSCQDGGGIVHRADCVARVTVVLTHRDTLGRPLPEGTAVELVDSRRRRHVGVIDADGVSHHPGVIAGPFAWQLLDAPGHHLVAVDERPVHPVAAG